MNTGPLERCTKCLRMWQPRGGESSATCPWCAGTIERHDEPHAQATPRRPLHADEDAPYRHDEDSVKNASGMPPVLIVVLVFLGVFFLLAVGSYGWLMWVSIPAVPPPLGPPPVAVVLPVPGEEDDAAE